MKKLGIAIKPTISGNFHPVTVNEGDWVRKIRDIRPALLHYPALQKDHNLIAALFFFDDEGCYIVFARTITDNDLENISGWIYIPRGLAITPDDLEQAIAIVRKMVSVSELPDKNLLQQIFGQKEYTFRPNPIPFTPSPRNGEYAKRERKNQTYSAMLLPSLYLSAYNGYEAVLIEDKPGEVENATDITETCAAEQRLIKSKFTSKKQQGVPKTTAAAKKNNQTAPPHPAQKQRTVHNSAAQAAANARHNSAAQAAPNARYNSPAQAAHNARPNYRQTAQDAQKVQPAPRTDHRARPTSVEGPSEIEKILVDTGNVRQQNQNDISHKLVLYFFIGLVSGIILAAIFIIPIMGYVPGNSTNEAALQVEEVVIPDSTLDTVVVTEEVVETPWEDTAVVTSTILNEVATQGTTATTSSGSSTSSNSSRSSSRHHRSRSSSSSEPSSTPTYSGGSGGSMNVRQAPTGGVKKTPATNPTTPPKSQAKGPNTMEPKQDDSYSAGSNRAQWTTPETKKERVEAKENKIKNKPVRE